MRQFAAKNAASHKADGFIAGEADRVLMEVWNQRHTLWSGRIPEHPIQVVEPGVALRLLGFSMVTQEDLGEMHELGKRVRVAGLINWEERVVKISPAYSTEEQLFTAAHELGHAVLHPGAQGVHRDRAMSGFLPWREKIEVEADYFASNFLMPELIVRRRFRECFLTQGFELNDSTAYALCQSNAHEVQQTYRTRRHLSRALATAVSYNGKSFMSLANYFRVSPTAMAIRLEELDLVVPEL